MVLQLLNRAGLLQTLTNEDFLDNKLGSLEELRLSPRWSTLKRTRTPHAHEECDPLALRILNQTLQLQQWAFLSRPSENSCLHLERNLFILARLAQAHIERGEIFSIAEKKHCLASIFDLCQQILTLRSEEIDRQIHNLIAALSSENPKAGVIAAAIQIDHALQTRCLERSQKIAIEIVRILEHCILSASVKWSNYNAQCIGEKLKGILQKIETLAQPNSSDILLELRQLFH